MPRKTTGNHAAQCKPVGEELCKRSLDGKKKPIRVTRPCPKCGEWRCLLHCGCKRRGVSRRVAKVRTRPAVKLKAEAQVLKLKEAAQVKVKTAVVLPLLQQAQPGPSVTVLGASAFWGSALKEVAAAKTTVFLGSLCYDNSRLQTQLVAALGRGLKVELLLDRATLRSGLAPKAVERLDKLKEKGAKVYLGSGKSYKRVFGREGHPGNYHAKVLVVDSVVAFVGSPNMTNNSLVNGEVAVRLGGGAVAKDVYKQAWAEAQRVDSY